MDRKEASRNDLPLKMLLVDVSEYDQNMADWWHERFLWKVHLKTHLRSNQVTDAAKEMNHWWSSHFDDWCDRCMFWNKQINIDPDSGMAYFAVVMYERAVSSPHLHELARLQTECEEYIEQIAISKITIEEAEKWCKFPLKHIRKVSEEKHKLIQEERAKNAERYAIVEKLLEQADSLRDRILQEC